MHRHPQVLELSTVGKAEVIDKRPSRALVSPAKLSGMNTSPTDSDTPQPDTDLSPATANARETVPDPAGSGGRLAIHLFWYTLARLGLVVVLAGLISLVSWLISVQIPLLVALLFAIVLALPLSIPLLRPLRATLDTDIAAFTARRTHDKQALHARLQGTTTTPE